MDGRWAIEWSVRIAGVGLLITGAEWWALRREFGPRGVFSNAAVSSGPAVQRAMTAVDRLIPALIAALLVSAAVLSLTGPYGAAGSFSLAVSAGLFLLLRWRRRLAGDGAEQMTAIILLAALVATVPSPGAVRTTAAVLFIAGQALLSYATAGIAKLASSTWRTGAALPQILSTHSHGNRWAASVLHRHHALAAAGCWSVIIWESTFGVLATASEQTLAVALAVGLAFHLGCAVLMGLNNFLWAFPATYPCIIVGTQSILPDLLMR